MKLHIEYFKNIKNLDIEFEENKINLIYGLSGSGKTSISQILTGDITGENSTFGVDKSLQKINITPVIPSEDILKYDDSYRRLFVNSENDNELYRVIFSNDSALEKLYDNILSLLKNLTSLEPEMNNYLVNIGNLRKELGLRGNSRNISTTSNIITKLESEVESSNYKSNLNYVKKYGIDRLKWIIEGRQYDSYTNGNCPFCNRKLSKFRKEKIDLIALVTPENYKAIANSEAYTKVFGIGEPNYSSKRSFNTVKKEIQQLLDTEDEVKKMLDLFKSFATESLDFNTLKKINISKTLSARIPSLKQAVDIYNINISDIKKKAKALQGNTNKLIEKNVDKINAYLDILGISYHFSVKKYDRVDKTLSTFLVHIDADGKKDNRESLSYGEINIISLVLFLFSVNKQYVIIDDPVSSYDDSKRTMIYNFILDMLVGKTVLLLSHDQTFVKNASLTLLEKDNVRKNRLGYIYYLYNTNENGYIIIDPHDFAFFIEHVKEFLNSNWEIIPYYQKILNMRILAECQERKKNKDFQLIYGYLSAILHAPNKGLTKEDVMSELTNDKTNEKEVLCLIQKYFGFDLQSMPEDFTIGFDYDSLSDFEKIIYKREFLDKRTNKYKNFDKYTKDIFSEVVHLNSQYIYALNPYKYSFYPKIIKDILDEKI